MGKSIAQVSFVYKPVNGGQGVYIENFINILKKNGMNCTVYQPYNLQLHPLVKMLPSEIRLVFSIPKLGRIIKNLDIYIFSLFLFLTKRRQLAKEDLVIVHYAFHALPLWGLKNVIILSHGIEWYLENQTINDKIHEFVARKTFNKFTIVANDTHYLRYLGLDVQPGQNYFSQVAPSKWFIPNCVDITKFNRTEPLTDLIGKKIILVPRQITEDRGILLAIEAFKLFDKVNSGYYLLIVGFPIKGKYFEQCKNLIAKYGLDEKAQIVGNVKNFEMSRYYSSATITLIPTLRREGTSLSALESMSCGTPTVSTNVAGLRDLPTIQAEPNPLDIKNKLEFTLKDHNSIGRTQSETVRSMFNMENWTMAWMSVIQKMA